jgi:hypothetical protein
MFVLFALIPNKTSWPPKIQDKIPRQNKCLAVACCVSGTTPSAAGRSKRMWRVTPDETRMIDSENGSRFSSSG